jgi:hypothetical protein
MLCSNDKLAQLCTPASFFMRLSPPAARGLEPYAGTTTAAATRQRHGREPGPMRCGVINSQPALHGARMPLRRCGRRQLVYFLILDSHFHFQAGRESEIPARGRRLKSEAFQTGRARRAAAEGGAQGGERPRSTAACGGRQSLFSGYKPSL